MKNKKYAARILVILIVSSLVFFILDHFGINDRGSLKNIKLRDIIHFLKGYGRYSAIIFILIYSLKPLVGIIPASLLSVASGILFGTFLGTLYTMIGAAIGATVAFYFARFLGKDFVDKILKGKLALLDENIGKNGFRIILLMRLSVIFPFDPLSYAAGLSKMSYKDFILGTIIGILPEMTAYNFFGTNIHNPFSKQTIIAAIILTVMALSTCFVKTKKKK